MIDMTGFAFKEHDPERAKLLSAQFHTAFYGGRTSADPADHSSELSPPLSEDQVVALRGIVVDLYKALNGEKAIVLGGGYTCDGCAARFTCPYLFDDYNTDGDCLAEK